MSTDKAKGKPSESPVDTELKKAPHSPDSKGVSDHKLRLSEAEKVFMKAFHDGLRKGLAKPETAESIEKTEGSVQSSRYQIQKRIKDMNGWRISPEQAEKLPEQYIGEACIIERNGETFIVALPNFVSQRSKGSSKTVVEIDDIL